MAEKIHPSVLVSELFYPVLKTDSDLEAALGRIAEIGYYEAVEIGPVEEARTLRFVREQAERNHWQLTQWITKDLLDRGLNPSSLDREEHRAVIARVRELVGGAKECGAKNFAMISGADPGPALRSEAKKNFFEVVAAACRELQEEPGMNLLIEPLDRFAHKKNLIGPTEEAIAFVSEVRREFPNVYFSWDSAHVALNGEDLLQSLERSAPLTAQVHLANAVTDPSADGYGDWHMPVGAPGFLDDACAAALLKKAGRVLPENGVRHFASVEMRSAEGSDPWRNERECRAFLQRALRAASE